MLQKTFIECLIIATALIVLSQNASAQAHGSSANSGPGAYSASDLYGSNATLRQAMDTMQAGNYAMAEPMFLEVLQSKPKEPRANLMLGVTEMVLGKWEDAKKYLEVAVAASPREPDPRSRLGVTLVQLGDIEGATAQRAELAKMDAACRGKCRNAKWIADGLAMVDSAIATAKAPGPLDPPN